MARIYSSAQQLVGKTPLLELSRFSKENNLNARILAKLEFFNIAGSVKDRVAISMLNDGEKKGLIKPDTLIIEPTSGNTGIGLCAVAAARGYRCCIVMPESMSIERRRLMAAYGAQVVLSPAEEGMPGAIALAQKLAAETPNSMIPGQFVNPANPEAHIQTTGPEIWEDTDGNVDIFIAGIGTGGTITGIGTYLKSKNPRVQIIGIEPETSAVLSGSKPGAHGIQGIGAGFVPEILNTRIIDRIIPVADADALRTARALGPQEGFLAGISSGAALYAASQLARCPENAGKTIVVLLPDSGERYLSTGLYDE